MPGALLHLAWGCCAGLCRPGSPLARLVVMAGYKKFKMPGVIIHLARSTGVLGSWWAPFVVGIVRRCGHCVGVWVYHWRARSICRGSWRALFVHCWRCSLLWPLHRCVGSPLACRARLSRVCWVCRGCAGFVAGVLGWVHCCRGRDHSLLALFIAVAIAQVCWVHR